MAKIPFSVKSVSQILVKALSTINEGHLSNFTKKTVPEHGLVKHVRNELIHKLGQENVFRTVKGLHDYFDDLVFLKQPDVDLCFWYKGKLHGVEFKLLRKGVSFYSGLEEAISYSTYGIDYAWVVHFFRKSFRNAKSYIKWMELVIENSGCQSVGYITSYSNDSKVIVYPRKRFEVRNNTDIGKVVAEIRKKLFEKKS